MSVTDWSPQPSGNAVADRAIAAIDGASGREIPGMVRSVMAGVRRYADAQGGALVTGGRLNAYTVDTALGVTELRPGLSLIVKANRDNTAEATLNVDGSGPLPWVDAAGVRLLAGRILKGRFYNILLDVDAPAWRVQAGASTLDEIPGLTDLQGDVADKAAASVAAAAAARSDAQVAEAKAAQVQADRADVLASRQAVADDRAAASSIRAAVAADRGAVADDRSAAQTARDQALTAIGTNRVIKDTQADLNADLAYPAGTIAEVLKDPATPTAATGNGYYAKLGAPGSGSWEKKSSATVTSVDAATQDVRYGFQFNKADGTLDVADDGGNVIMRVDPSKGLQALLATFSRLIAGESVSAGTMVLANTSATDGFDFADDMGNVLARLHGGGKGFEVEAILASLFENGNFSLRAYPDAGYALVISDSNGWVIASLDAGGLLQVPAIKTLTATMGGDYSAEYIAERSARAVALSAGYRGLLDTTSACAIWTYNHALWFGQSLGAAQEAWPPKTLQGMIDVLMLGLSTRPGGANTATMPSPLGDSILRPAVATAQVQNTGALLDAAAQAALPAGNDALGEDPGVGAMQFARRLFLQRLGVERASDRRFVTTNVAVSGRSIEELSKGASTEYFKRLPTMATAVKNAATGAGGSYGVAALFWLQGEWNYSGSNGGSTDKATYKANLKKLYDDFVADVCVGIADQTEKPAIITYQTGAAYTVDTTDMSIGMAQWEMSDGNPITGGLPGWYLAAPAYPVTDKGGHLDPNGSRWLGLQMGKVFHETVVMRRRWKPLSPIQATYRGRTLLVDFHLPSGTPLQFRPVYRSNGTTSLFADKGFTVIDDSGVIPLASVTLAGDAVVQIVLQRAPVGTVNVYYARQTTFSGNGNLCDSDPTVAPFNYEYSAGSGDYATANIPDLVGKPYPLWNWCIAFKMQAVAN